MVVATVGRRARGQAGPGQGRDGARCGESEGSRSDLPRRAARDPRRRPQTTGEPRARRRGRRGDRLAALPADRARSEEHTSELQSLAYLVCRLLLEKKKKK